MKKLLFLLIAVITTVISGFAADETPAYTCTFSSETFGQSVQTYTTEWQNNCGGNTWNIVNFNNNQKKWAYVRCGRRNIESVATITTDFAPAESINKVVVQINGITISKVNEIYLQVSSSKTSFTSPKIAPTEILAGPMEFIIPNPAPNQYYRLTFDCASGTANGFVEVGALYYYAAPATDPSKTEATLTWSKVSDDITFGDSFVAPTLEKSADDVVVTYASDNADLLAVDAATGEMTLTQNVAGTANITASVSAEDPNYYGTPAVYTLTVIDPAAPKVVYSSAEGDDFELENPVDLTVWTHDSYNYLKATAYKDKTNHACEGAMAISPVIDASEYKEITLDFSAAYNYFGSEDRINEFVSVLVKTENDVEWTKLPDVATPNDYALGWTFIPYGKVSLPISNERIQVAFKYTSTTEVAGTWEIKNIVVEGVLGQGKVNPELSFGNVTEFSIMEGQTFTAPALIKPEGLTVSYASSNTEVATVDVNTGAVTLGTACGTTTITATSEETETYLAGEAGYTLTVTENLVTGLWKKVTSLEALNESTPYMLAGNRWGTWFAFNGEYKDDTTADLTAVEFNSYDEYLENDDTKGLLTIAKNGEYYTMFVAEAFKMGTEENTSGYLTCESTAGEMNGYNALSRLCVVPEASEASNITLSVDEAGAWSGVFQTSTDAGSNRTHLRFNLNGVRVLFGCFASGQQDFYLYEPLTEALEAPLQEVVADGVTAVDLDANFALQYQKPRTLKIDSAPFHKAYWHFEEAPTADAPQQVAAENESEKVFTEYTEPIVMREAGKLTFYTMLGKYKSAERVLNVTGSTTSSISEIGADEAGEAEWFDVQGRRVAKPAKGGVYILKQGSTVSKHIL